MGGITDTQTSLAASNACMTVYGGIFLGVPIGYLAAIVIYLGYTNVAIMLPIISPIVVFFFIFFFIGLMIDINLKWNR